MTTKLIGLLIAASFGLAGCATTPTDPALAAKQEHARATAPSCNGERDCAAKWDAAQLWVVKNAGYKIQTATNVLIQTYSPPNGSTALGAEVTKEGKGGGLHVINARIWCGNWIGCEREPIDALLDFNRTVAAAQP